MTGDAPDWAEFVRNRRVVSEIECARLRRLLVGSSRSVGEVSEDGFSDYTHSQLMNHATGWCAHDHGVPAVEVEKRWVPRE